MSYKIFVVNTGSTSTKIALYEDEKEVFTKSLSHPDELINKFDDVQDQLNMRLEFVRSYLDNSLMSNFFSSKYDLTNSNLMFSWS